MASDDLLNVVGNVYATNVEGAVLAHEAAHASHVVSVVAVLVAAEAVDVRIEDVVDGGQAVQVLALLALGAQALGEEEAEVAPGDPVGARVATVLGYVAPRGSGSLRQILVLPVASRPLVVPDVEDRSRLRRRLALKRVGVHLRPRRSPSPLHDGFRLLLLCLLRHDRNGAVGR